MDAGRRSEGGAPSTPDYRDRVPISPAEPPAGDQPVPIATSGGAPGHSATALPVIIYDLEEIASGKHYVGLTSHALSERSGRHVAQSRRHGPIRPGGLMEAIRRAAAAGVAFRDAFRSRLLARATSLDEARLLERSWIEKLSCRTPSGLNLMPGGSSVGGPANAMPCRLELADGGVRLYASLRLAIADGNRYLAMAGRPALQARTVYARLTQGWTLAQALGQVHRPDARGLGRPSSSTG